MNSRDILLDTQYVARRPPRRAGVPEVGEPGKAWEVTVIAKGQEMQLRSGRTISTGVQVRCDHTDQVHTLEPRDIIATVEDRAAERAARKQRQDDYAAWKAAREAEIADSHLTMCAHLQRNGHDIPESLRRPANNYRATYTLTAEQILALTGATLAEIASAVVRPDTPPKEPKLPTARTAAQTLQRMLVLGAVEGQIRRCAETNEDPVDMTGVVGPGADGERVYGYISEIARTDDVVRRCAEHGLSASKVRKTLTDLHADEFIRTVEGFDRGWQITAAGRASLREHQAVTSA